jgi:hypothetical protein
MKKRRNPKEFSDDKEELSPELRRELKRQLADAHNPVRYVVFSDISGDGRWRLWLDVSGDGYSTSIDQATLFKREHVARSVAKAYSEGRRGDLLVAKITTQNGRRKILKCEKPQHRTSDPRRRGKPRIADG